jgi:hypothetical protein
MNNFEFLKKLKLISDNIECIHLNQGCELGWYGGKPTIQNCKVCIAAERNNPDAKKISDARAERTHPSSAPRVSGCCDSALNPSF